MVSGAVKSSKFHIFGSSAQPRYHQDVHVGVATNTNETFKDYFRKNDE